MTHAAVVHDLRPAERSGPRASDTLIRGRRVLPYPDGWFAVCFGHELKRGNVRTVPFMGQELVVYRTHAGEAFAVEPFCPHLGAHLGHGGKVDGDDLVCPFHGLAFAPDGRCVRACGGQKPPHATLTRRFTQERNGMVVVWNHRTGQAPEWEIPDVDTQGFSKPKGSSFDLEGYPHDVAENATDLSHFAWLHGLTDVAMHHEAGPQWMTTHLSGRWHGIEIKIRLTSHGLGYVLGESDVASLGVKVTTCAFPTPTAPLKWTFRWTDALRVARMDALPAVLRRPLYALIIKLAHKWFVHVVAADFPIWSNRRYVEHPKLMAGDAAVAAFRRWSAQFYPGAPVSDTDLPDIDGGGVWTRG